MKVLCTLLPLLFIVGGGNTAPTAEAPVQNQLPNENPPTNTKEDHVIPNLSKPGDGDLRPSLLAGEPLEISGERMKEENKDDFEELSSYESLDDVDIADSEYSYPSWMLDGYFTSVNDATVDGDTEKAILAELEAVLVNEKLEPLYKSISHLKTLLYQLRERAADDAKNIGESVIDEESFYSSSEYDVSSAVAGEGENARFDEVSEEEQRIADQHRQGNQEVPSKNASKATLKNNAVESAMNDIPENHKDAFRIHAGRRFKRDLGWGRLSDSRFGNQARADVDISSSGFADEAERESEVESSWTGSSEAEEYGVDLSELARKPFRFRERIRIGPREETNWMNVLLNLRGRVRAPSQKFNRRRRNKEDIRAFLNSMPTLEGLRKRTLPLDEDPEEEAVIPDPGPFYPMVPPTLPPPDNVIRPTLSPDDSFPWQLPPTFDEDNALLEEQTNGIGMINPFNKRYNRYLEDVERSIMDESLEDLALELAGRKPLRSNEALRVRRVMQIPPPPPYGRKVVKSLYRKKAYGYPFIEDEFADELIPGSWESDSGSSEIPYEVSDIEFDPEDLDEPHSWGEFLQFGRIEGPGGYASGAVSRLLSAIRTKEAKDKILKHLLRIKDAAPRLQRQILLQALMAEADQTDDVGNDVLGYLDRDSEPDEGLDWGTFKADNPDHEAEEEASDELIDDEPSQNNVALEKTEGDSAWESSLSDESRGNEADYFSEASESDASVADWGNTADKLQSNVGDSRSN